MVLNENVAPLEIHAEIVDKIYENRTYKAISFYVNIKNEFTGKVKKINISGSNEASKVYLKEYFIKEED